jgi:hypothetical protein
VTSPFAALAPSPRAHFTLCFYGALVRLRPVVGGGAPDGFLATYWRELAGAPEAGSIERWRTALDRWEAAAGGHLPLAALRHGTGLSHSDVEILLAAGLVEEDMRFGELVAGLQGGEAHRRPTGGLLRALAGAGAADSLRHLLARGLLVADDAALPAPDRALRPAPGVWPLLAGARDGVPEGLALEPPAGEGSATPVFPAPLLEALGRLPTALGSGAADTLVVRGPETTGRRTFLRAVAHRRDQGLLVAGDDPPPHVGMLALLAGALPVLRLEPGPGEEAELPAFPGYAGPLGVTLPAHGGLRGPRAERVIVLEIGLPDRAERIAHWRAALPEHPHPTRLAAAHRMTGGHIRRTARLARAAAALHGRAEPATEDVRHAARTLHGRLLDTLCEPVPPAAGLGAVALPPDVREELETLVARCRHRERLATAFAPRRAAAGRGAHGVRALLTGPSGTGKSLAARAVAGELGVDLYRLDLAAVVDKYLGETEKNLARIFDRAEQADVALLLDEGDALLTQRTSVANANDRYANLETNFLLQRLETFAGILLVTTNAGERIDPAFRRRMDLVVDVPAPAPPARQDIWQSHLPVRHHVGDDELAAVAAACALTGGQIRNAALHATLLALTNGGSVTRAHLHDAVRREYRKAGQVCPLPEPARA